MERMTQMLLVANGLSCGAMGIMGERGGIMKLYDVSTPISVDMPVFKNEPSRRPELIPIKSIDENEVVIHKILLDLHSGTHVDAPSHYFKGGKTIDQLSMTKEVTTCRVIDLTRVEGGITKADLERFNIAENEFLLLKTKNSSDILYNPEFVYLTDEAAAYLLEKKIKGIGIDAMTIERNQPEHETHKMLLEKEVMIIEGLRLKYVSAGTYSMVALPINIVGAEAAPTRVLLIEGL